MVMLSKCGKSRAGIKLLNPEGLIDILRYTTDGTTYFFSTYMHHRLGTLLNLG